MRATPVCYRSGNLLIRFSVVIPLVTGPFGFLYLAHDLMIFSITGYFQRELSRDVSQLLGRDISLADTRFEHLSDAGLLAHQVLAPGR